MIMPEWPGVKMGQVKRIPTSRWKGLRSTASAKHRGIQPSLAKGSYLSMNDGWR